MIHTHTHTCREKRERAHVRMQAHTQTFCTPVLEQERIRGEKKKQGKTDAKRRREEASSDLRHVTLVLLVVGRLSERERERVCCSCHKDVSHHVVFFSFLFRLPLSLFSIQKLTIKMNSHISKQEEQHGS